jgi:uncharacterized DUF497 family protein
MRSELAPVFATFEWDENKRHPNLLKHGIDFIRAA